MISEETLTYYYYDDGLSVEQRGEVEAALKTDAQLVAQYAILSSELDQLTFDDEAPVSELLVQRLHKSIGSAKDHEASKFDGTIQLTESSGFRKPNVMASRITAIAASLILTFGIGTYYFESAQNKALVFNTVVSEQAAERLSTPFLRGLQVHLRNARLELDRGVLPEKADSSVRYQALLAVAGQNRMFEKAAELNNASGLARVLRAFEPSLLRLAEQDLSPEQARALHAKLAFEIDVMLTKLSRSPSNERYSI